jgi:ribose transport system substrate-binding protein
MMSAMLKRFLLCCLVLPALVLGCDGEDSAAENGAVAGGEGGESFVVGMSQANLAEPYRVQMNADIAEAAKAYPNLQIIYKDAQKDSLKQRGHVEEFVSQGVDLILISPNEPAPLQGPVEAAMERGIPVIVIDRRLPEGTSYTSFIGADNYKIGLAAGKWIVQELGGQGNVVELKGMMSTDPAIQRNRGFREAIAGTGINVIFDVDMKWDQSQAKSEMESALSRFADIDLVYAHNDPGAYGAHIAADAAGRAGEMKFVGIDALPSEGVAYVRQGVLDASFEYPTGGARAVEMAMKILNGQTVEKEIVLDSVFFTKQNVEKGGEPLTAIGGGSDAAPPATRPGA